MSKYYIAYGSNLSVAQMAFRCPDARIIGTATLKDWKLTFRIHATIEPVEGYNVPVLIWEISDADEKRLDRYEGFPKYYVKSELPVEMTFMRSKKTKNINAMVYVMVQGRPITMPSKEYYNTILEGYDRFGFDTTILSDALIESLMNHQKAE